ncbi:MAG: glycosyltransferase family 4 protein [Chloroflexota bacterium]
MLKIAHVTATFWPNNTGTGNVAYHNALELARLGHEVHVFTPRLPETAVTETRDGFTVHRLRPFLSYGNAFFLPQLAWRLASFDIIHVHMPFYGGAEAVWLLKLLTGKPVVITHHQDVKLDGLAGWINRFHDATLTNSLMRMADRVCFTSLDYGNASKYGRLIAKERVSYQALPNGIDVERFTAVSDTVALREKHNLQGKFILLFVGVLDRAHYFKGVEKLIRAVQKINQSHLKLIIVGKGDMQSDYQKLALELGIGHQVRFAGFVPDEQLPEMYRLADTAVLPSTTMGEAFGLVLLESLSSGTPVIASALPGVRTVVTNYQDGFLVEPSNVEDLAQKIEQMMQLPAEDRQQMGQKGRQKVMAQYAWPKIGSQLDQLYRTILKPKKLVASQTKQGSSL